MDSSNLVIESQIDSKTYDNSYGSGNISAPIGTKSAGERQRRRMQDYKSNIPIWNEEEGVKWTICEYILMFFAWFICLIIPLFWFFLIKTVRDYERALIFRLGKLKGGAEGPGVFFVNPLMDSIFVVDLRMETFDLPPQGMMTKDAVTVDVDAISFLKVIDPIKAILEVDDYRFAFKNISATTLRAVIGTYNLQSLLSERDEINEKIRNIIEDETSSWGVAVPAVEIKDVKLPQNMQRAMAAEAEAERERRAKIVSAAGEAEAAEQLAKAADIICDSPGALQLRYLHTLMKISAEKNSTILFPLPMEIMRGLQNFNANQEANQLRRRREQVRNRRGDNEDDGGIFSQT